MIDELRVEVLDIDIQQGIPAVPNHCPIALAVKREYPYLEDVAVDSLDITAYDKVANLEYEWTLPAMAETFVENFDLGLAVEPFGFSAERTLAFVPD